jgi:hypothetical protein
MRDDTITLQIREDYRPEEIAEMGKKLAGKLADLETVASDKKAADATFNERKSNLQAEAETLFKQINHGYEMAQIGCDIRYNDPTPGQKSYYRMDNSAHVKTEDMSWEEKQEELQFNLHAPAEGQPQPTDEQVVDELKKIEDVDRPEPPIVPPPESADEPPEAA